MGRIYLLLAICLLASCGLFTNKTQKITINTANGKPANCTLKNDLGVWQATSDEPVEIKKSEASLKIRCTAKTYHAYKSVAADASHIYPSTVTVYLKARKSQTGPKDSEDEDSPSEINGDNDDSRPLNMLTDEPDENNEK